MKRTIFAFLRLFVMLGLIAFVGQFAPEVLQILEKSNEPEVLNVFFSIAVIFSLSFGVFYLSRGTPLPSFVIAIFFGLAAHPFLLPVTENHVVLATIVGFGATLILFGGGLETPFDNFRKLFGKIMSLSFIGFMLAAILLSLGIYEIGHLANAGISVTTAVLLGALLASTDPAAIIPVLKRLRFKNPSTRDIIVSESAITDVTGTLLTITFLSMIAAGVMGASVLESYASIFSLDTAILFATQLLFGTVFGIAGYVLLDGLTRFKGTHDREYEADSAFFLFIPIIIFTLALAFGGSGYLAAFVAGLLFKLSDNLHETEHFFNHIIDGFFKPTIFLMLGALIDLPSLITYAPVGILAAAVFMFVIRPFTVFASLVPFVLFGSTGLKWRELAFISFIRETGAIPAVLLVTIASLNLPNIEGLLPIGTWVILATLVVEPPLTPWIAKKLNVAKLIPENKGILAPTLNSAVVLGSRGGSWSVRLPVVVDWASRHGIPNVILLVCLEHKFTLEKLEEIREGSEKLMADLNEQRADNGEEPVHFTFIGSEGFLQEHVEEISKNQENIVAIFVGRKMLDFKIDEVKQLNVPLYFIE